MLLCFAKKLVGGNPDSPHADMAALLFLNAAHVVSMNVHCLGTDAAVHDLVISLVNGKEWVLPYSESRFNQTGFDQWRAYVRQDHLNQIDEEASDARLIAAAPEMYELLEEYAQIVDADAAADWFQRRQALLDKIEGGGE